MIHGSAIHSSELALKPPPPNDDPSQGSVQIEVRLFAGAAQLAGTHSLTMEIDRGSGLNQLCELLIAQQPALEGLVRVSRWAVGSDFVAGDFLIAQPLTIAMIPPVSGG